MFLRDFRDGRRSCGLDSDKHYHLPMHNGGTDQSERRTVARSTSSHKCMTAFATSCPECARNLAPDLIGRSIGIWVLTPGREIDACGSNLTR